MKTVLIAEDNPTNRELLRELLEIRGYGVAEACDGKEALAMVEQAPPDLLLLAIGMPLMDGFAVVRKLRENPRFTSLPVVADTSLASTYRAARTTQKTSVRTLRLTPTFWRLSF